MNTKDLNDFLNGIEVLKKYKCDFEIYPKSESKHFAEVQEEEFSAITLDDVAKLEQYGWAKQSQYMFWFVGIKNES